MLQSIIISKHPRQVVPFASGLLVHADAVDAGAAMRDGLPSMVIRLC